MSDPAKLSAGGGYYAITATPSAIDLSALRGYQVAFSCDTADFYISGAADGSSTTLVTAAPAPASVTALVADRIGAAYKAKRLIRRDQTFAIVATVTGSATLRVKIVSDKDPQA